MKENVKLKIMEIKFMIFFKTKLKYHELKMENTCHERKKERLRQCMRVRIF